MFANFTHVYCWLFEQEQKAVRKTRSSFKFEYVLFFKQLANNPFIGKLSETEYHAHIKYSWVAVWEVDKRTKTVKITYIGSREDAPYGR